MNITQHPVGNALAAAAYIVGIVFVIQKATSLEAVQQTLLIPVAMLSLFVLSAAVMGFLFFIEPLRLYVDNRRHDALAFFGKTLASFAALVAVFFLVLWYISL